MSSELDNENNGGLLHYSKSPAKIEPATPAPNHLQEEKKDSPKSESQLQPNQQPSSRTDPHNFYRDVYSSSPEDEDGLNLEQEAADQFIEIAISEPHKVGEGISSFMAYKVSTNTNSKLFRKQSFSVVRRFSDFLGKSFDFCLISMTKSIA